MMRKCGLFVLGLLSLAACAQSSDLPSEADYTLLWYSREGTDFARIVPGFTSLAMCRYAGASQTMQHLVDKHGYQSDYTALESTPWFECGTACRIDNSKIVICEKVEESHGVAARAPADYSAQAIPL